MTLAHPPSQAVDAVSIGFGPAAIALACAFEDAREEGGALARRSIRFFERAAEAAWHPELLLNGTDINHHVFRDLVTPRNPRSRFSFAMYQKVKGRMFDFGLLGRPASRAEWSDYVGWVARQVDGSVSYSTAVHDILPGIVDGRLDHVRIDTGREVTRTRSLVVSTGSAPAIPDGFLPHIGARMFHTSEFLTRVEAFGGALPRRWLVVGSGQSASESVLELIERRPDIEVVSLHRSAGFRLTQLGHFPNQVFSPRHVDYFHDLGHDQRRAYLQSSRSTNYAGIDPDESQKLYSLIYEDSLAGRRRLTMMPYHRVAEIAPNDAGCTVTAEDVFTGRTTQLSVDAVVLGTGYHQPVVPPLLAGLQPWLRADADGGLLVDRDYRAATTEDCDVRVFVNGLSERSHGISDSQSFSLMALRAERIADGIAAA